MQPRNTIFREIICNEQITNLLDPSKRNLQIREDVKSGVYVENLTEEYEDVTQVLVKVCFVCHALASFIGGFDENPRR
ncbi:kinesin-like protein KIN-12A isoform X2 [Pistacia vera]|uniref:kinesin-like protein KIN-12A isoform X2 n=1 Tax=Pistacia vera TaxID=55513 RepID=UPI001263539B|nr:kinesin-like protein KIN-12A isoform X2 [Pistacia vera]